MTEARDPVVSDDLAAPSSGAETPRPKAYIVIVSPTYGGAEKRFFDIFRGLRAQGKDVQLIAPSSLSGRLLADHPNASELADAVIPVPLDEWKPLAFIRGYRQILRTLPRGSSFHYPLNCLWPLHLGRGDRITLSVADCVHTPRPTLINRVDLWTWLSFFVVDRIDVLSPAIFANMKRYRMAGKMSMTPGGTFIEAPPPSDVERQPIVVLVSRLVALKGIDDLLEVLPDVWRLMRERAHPRFAIRLAGYGPMEKHVAERVAALAQSGVPVEFIGYADAKALFPSVAVALSMQEATNYPSRVVAEALVSGCGAIVRDTGDSRQFGELPGLLYCSGQLNASQLADQIVDLVNAVLNIPSFSDEIKDAALDRFGGRSSVVYFDEMLATGS
jgi:glycosyltransferase involved in cell wall biosynthesis